MRLVTYDRGGERRLGAWITEGVVDLPDAIGHPAFPTTMEALLQRNGGTVLDAAHEALGKPDVLDSLVPRAKLLVPTEQGRAAVALIGPCHATAAAQLAKTLGEQPLADAVAALRSLSAALDEAWPA